MGEHPTAAIAAFLEITVNAVKTRLYSARKRMRKHMGDIEENLETARPSSSAKFAEKVRRMIQPEPLKKKSPLLWSPGMGSDVWEMFCACIKGDLETVKRLVDRDSALARCNYGYRTPIYFAVRENQIEVTVFLLEHGADPLGHDLLNIARDRGYVDLEKLLEAKFASLHGASSKGEAVAEAIRERDLPKMRSLLDGAPELLHVGDPTSTTHPLGRHDTATRHD